MDGDTYKNVLTNNSKRYFGIRDDIVKALACHLSPVPLMDKRKKEMQKWSDFDAYNNYEKLKKEIKKADEPLLQNQMRAVERRLMRLKKDIVDVWELVGMEEYLEEKDGNKKKAVVAKTAESMQAGNYFHPFL